MSANLHEQSPLSATDDRNGLDRFKDESFGTERQVGRAYELYWLEESFPFDINLKLRPTPGSLE